MPVSNIATLEFLTVVGVIGQISRLLNILFILRNIIIVVNAVM